MGRNLEARCLRSPLLVDGVLRIEGELLHPRLLDAGEVVLGLRGRIGVGLCARVVRDCAHAVQLLLLADHQLRSGLILDGLARAYEASGDTEQAARWLKTLNDDQNAFGWEPQQDWLASYVRLARLDLVQGRKDEAKALLSQFLGLWKDADPDIPVLKEAKAEYAKLK